MDTIKEDFPEVVVLLKVLSKSLLGRRNQKMKTEVKLQVVGRCGLDDIFGLEQCVKHFSFQFVCLSGSER